jgi:type II secretory pathway pseudopilin PulG
MKPQFLVVLAILATLSVITLPVFKTNSQALTDKLESNEALSVVRLVATTEGEKKSTVNSFVTLRELMTHPAMNGRLEEISMVDSHTATFRNYTLTVIPSADGQHFQVSLVPKSGCGYTLFTNETFVIYEAKASGCAG